MKKKFKNLKQVRKNIDNVDARLVKLIAEREFYAREAVKFKIDRRQIIDRKRINAVLSRIKKLSRKNSQNLKIVLSYFIQKLRLKVYITV